MSLHSDSVIFARSIVRYIVHSAKAAVVGRNFQRACSLKDQILSEVSQSQSITADKVKIAFETGMKEIMEQMSHLPEESQIDAMNILNDSYIELIKKFGYLKKQQDALKVYKVAMPKNGMLLQLANDQDLWKMAITSPKAIEAIDEIDQLVADEVDEEFTDPAPYAKNFMDVVDEIENLLLDDLLGEVAMDLNQIESDRDCPEK